MTNICSADIPDGSLLAEYNDIRDGKIAENFCDCYSVTVNGIICLEELVYAFYTCPVFAIERRILAIVLGVPSSDEYARQLSTGQCNRYLAWTVENRREHEMLLRFPKSHTGSWFMVRHTVEDGLDRTELLFGSVVFPKKSNTGFGLIFHCLSGFHRLYSAALLKSAKKRVITLRTSDQQAR